MRAGVPLPHRWYGDLLRSMLRVGVRRDLLRTPGYPCNVDGDCCPGSQCSSGTCACGVTGARSVTPIAIARELAAPHRSIRVTSALTAARGPRVSRGPVPAYLQVRPATQTGTAVAAHVRQIRCASDAGTAQLHSGASRHACSLHVPWVRPGDAIDTNWHIHDGMQRSGRYPVPG